MLLLLQSTSTTWRRNFPDCIFAIPLETFKEMFSKGPKWLSHPQASLASAATLMKLHLVKIYALAKVAWLAGKSLRLDPISENSAGALEAHKNKWDRRGHFGVLNCSWCQMECVLSKTVFRDSIFNWFFVLVCPTWFFVPYRRSQWVLAARALLFLWSVTNRVYLSWGRGENVRILSLIHSSRF